MSDCIDFINWMEALEVEAKHTIYGDVTSHLSLRPAAWKDVFDNGYSPEEALADEMMNWGE